MSVQVGKLLCTLVQTKQTTSGLLAAIGFGCLESELWPVHLQWGNADGVNTGTEANQTE